MKGVKHMWESEKTKKEMFTKENVEADIKSGLKIEIGAAVFGIVLVSVLCLIIFGFFSSLKIPFLWGFVIYAICVLVFALEIIVRMFIMKKVSKGEVVIKTSVLIKCKASHSDFQNVTTGSSVEAASLNKLEFDCFGTYSIPERQHYKWSSLHKMDAKSIRNYSTIGDEFYIAVIGNKIYSVYNKKLFEYKE